MITFKIDMSNRAGGAVQDYRSYIVEAQNAREALDIGYRQMKKDFPCAGTTNVLESLERRDDIDAVL